MFVMVLVFILTVSVVLIEIFVVNSYNSKIMGIEKNLAFLDNIIENNKYLEMSLTILRGSGQNLEAKRGNDSTLDLAGVYSIQTNLRLQETVVAMCENTNLGINYSQIQLDCSKVGLNGLPDKNELINLNKARVNLLVKKNSIEGEKTELIFKKDFWSSLRNLFYILLVSLTGIGAAIRYFFDKLYVN